MCDMEFIENLIFIHQILFYFNIVAKKTIELVQFFHKKTTKLVFIRLNMGQKGIKVLKIVKNYMFKII